MQTITNKFIKGYDKNDDILKIIKEIFKNNKGEESDYILVSYDFIKGALPETCLSKLKSFLMTFLKEMANIFIVKHLSVL